MSGSFTKGCSSHGKGQRRTERQAADLATPGSEKPWIEKPWIEKPWMTGSCRKAAVRLSDNVFLSHVKDAGWRWRSPWRSPKTETLLKRRNSSGGHDRLPMAGYSPGQASPRVKPSRPSGARRERRLPKDQVFQPRNPTAARASGWPRRSGQPKRAHQRR